MLGFLWRFIARGLDSLFSLLLPVLPTSVLFGRLLVEVGDLGAFDLSSRPVTMFADFTFGETLSFAGKTGALAAGVEGTVSEPLGDEGVDDGGVEDGGEAAWGVVRTMLVTAPVLVFIFLARVVRILSSSSEEG
jgi:hypothetical protein